MKKIKIKDRRKSKRIKKNKAAPYYAWVGFILLGGVLLYAAFQPAVPVPHVKSMAMKSMPVPKVHKSAPVKKSSKPVAVKKAAPTVHDHLIKAINDGDRSAMKAHIKDGASVDRGLRHVLSKGKNADYRSVKLMVKNGANVNDRVVRLAEKTGNKKIIKYINKAL